MVNGNAISEKNAPHAKSKFTKRDSIEEMTEIKKAKNIENPLGILLKS
jgi:hypothetical protein